MRFSRNQIQTQKISKLTVRNENYFAPYIITKYENYFSYLSGHIEIFKRKFSFFNSTFSKKQYVFLQAH